MSVTERASLIGKLKSGAVNGLVNAALLTYGFDAPVVSYAFSVRYIRSRPLWVQMVGRVIRGAPGKEKAIFVDHTGTINNFNERGKYGKTGDYPHIFADPNIRWDFEGKKITRCLFDRDCACINKSKRKTPHCLFDYRKLCGAVEYYCKPECIARVSSECPKEIVKAEFRSKEFQMVDAELVNFTALISESKPNMYRVAMSLAREYAQKKDAEIIRKLKIIADQYNYKSLWIYWELNKDNHKSADTFALQEISKIYNYKPTWIKWATECVMAKLAGVG
jgi:hypothetical protein